MSKILIITDTSSDIPVELLKKDNIETIPMIFTINGKPFSENVDFSNDNFYEVMSKRDCVSSFQIPAAVYIDRYTNAESQGYTDIFVITSDSKITPMYSSALEGKKMYINNNPNSSMNIHVINSISYTMGTGLLVLATSKLVDENNEPDYILNEINNLTHKIGLIVNSFCIKYTRADDPIEWVKRMTAEITHPYPTFNITEGKAVELSIIKGNHTAFDQFYEYCKKSLEDKKPSYAIGYAVRKKEATAIAMLLENELGYPPVSIYKIGAFSSFCSGIASITLSFLDENTQQKVDED